MINYVEGDLFLLVPKDRTIIVPHVVNSVGKFASGFAAGVKKFYPVATKFYFDQKLSSETEYVALGDVYYCLDDNIIFAHMVAQTTPGTEKPIKYSSLVKCMESVRDYAKSANISEIYAPKFGSLRAGGNWNFIEELVNEIWKDFKVIIFTYKEEGVDSNQRHVAMILFDVGNGSEIGYLDFNGKLVKDLSKAKRFLTMKEVSDFKENFDKNKFKSFQKCCCTIFNR